MIVKKLKVFPVEAIVRGYITGSAWKEYKKQGTVHGIKVPEGLRESDAFEKPLFTPSTKAEQGEHGRPKKSYLSGNLIFPYDRG